MKYLLGLWAITIGISCNKEKTLAIPQYDDYEFYIGAHVDNNLLVYPQVNVAGTNVSNTYFTHYRQTWIQAYSDSVNYKQRGAWEIRVYDVDLSTVKLPYTLQKGEGSIAWFDPKYDTFVAACADCQGIDAGCTFMMASAGNTITITKFGNNIIEGVFSGTANLQGIGFSRFEDKSKNHKISGGKFRINYREDNSPKY